MIVFYHQKTGEIIGTIEGRVHYTEHLNCSISRSDIQDEDVRRIIIGYEDTGLMKTITKEGEEIEVPIYKEHNLSLWEHQLAWEDPLNPRQAHKERVILKQGEVNGFEPKT